MFLLAALFLQAQVAEPQKAPEPSPVALERIRHNLEREVDLPVIGTASERKPPTFRVYVNEKLPPVELWTEDTLTPSYVKTFFPLYHHEFLEGVTPEEFRAATLYPIGVEVLGLVDHVATGVRKALRARAEA